MPSSTHFSVVNDVMYTWWYSLAWQRNVPVGGPKPQEEVLSVAERLGYDQFKVSHGWLESFKSLHNLKQLTVSGEASDVAE